jgi:prepilin-type N-terminal cleavage/methylation domain-containing protein
MTCLNKSTGFSLVELIISISIIALLAGMAVPALNRVVEKQALSSYAHQLAGDIRYVRHRKINRENYSITLKKKSYEIIKENAILEIINAPKGIYYDGPNNKKIEFSYSGATAGEGMTIRLLDSYGDGYEIRITPVTGRVRIYPNP